MARGSFVFWTTVKMPKAGMRRLGGMAHGGIFWRAVENAFTQTGRYMQADAAMRVPTFTGALKKSLNYLVIKRGGDSSLSFYSDSPYAAPVEYGSAPHEVMSERVRMWAEAKGISAAAMYNAIALRGTRPHPFFNPTVAAGQDALIRKLEIAIKRFVRG